MASGSKPRWRDRLRSWKPSTSVTQHTHKTGRAALQSVLGALQSSLDQLPPLQLAVEGLLECIVHLEIAEQNRQAYDGIVSDLTSLAGLLQRHLVDSNPQNLPYSMENVARAIHEQTDYIKQQQDRSRDTRLKDLLPTHDAYYNAALPTIITKRVGCTKNTRVEILKAILEWARGVDLPPVYWMNGMAGTGKTTIAYTICKMLHEDRQLGASFFCSRNSSDCRNVNKIVPTIAYQLGRYSNPYRRALCDVLKGDPDVAKRDITTQFEQLISKPLAVMGKAMPDNVVVVIDALDECDDVGGTKDVLNLLLQCAADLPIKLFVTSRPEPVISIRMATLGGVAHSILRLHDIEESLVQADIKTYLDEALESMDLTSDEIDQLAAKAGRLFVFAATAVRYILPDAGSVDHRQRLRTVVKLRPNQTSKSYEDVDDLYTTILLNALNEKRFEQPELDGRRQALWTVVCTREPLTITALAEILDVPSDRAVQLAIQPLQSVLHVSESTNVVSTFHASFPEFLLDRERAGRFHCDEALQSAFLAQCCFRVMERSLRFNICGLESSYQLDADVPDLDSRADDAISTSLFYSCVYWGDHLAQASYSDLLLLLLDLFMQHRLLFWMEVLNLTGQLDYGDGILGQALAWLPAENKPSSLRNLIHDARNFVTALASSPISLSTPHIYISALPFTSKRSDVRAIYWPKTRGLLQVDGAAMDERMGSVLAIWEVEGPVYSIAQTNDGKFVASSSVEMTYPARLGEEVPGKVSIWDASSGIRVLGPWEGHQSRIKALAFSQDGAHLASGSVDHTICIWDASSGDLIAGPFRGHTSAVSAVVFSPNGSCLASGSDDHTIRMWNAYSGALLGEPLGGHQGPVTSVAFSPTGQHFASSSSDKTIQVWDFRGGWTFRSRMEGHTDKVNSIAYSHDGVRLASGSEDRTVRVWNTSDGTLLAGPFEGHTWPVRSVSFSSDGARVVSGSEDYNIRVWEAVSGKLLAGPLEGHKSIVTSVLTTRDGTRILSSSFDRTIRVWDARYRETDATEPLGHTGAILSVALSPDGTRLASGSIDSTICVWDTHKGTRVAGPFKGHTGLVLSVAFSPDGARIASGSGDYTLCTWDASTGTLLVGPLRGHASLVNSVAFSPDGSQIISGSYDKTIRIWNSRTGESLAKSFKVYDNEVTSIASSSDGTRIVSGSSDRTLRMWRASNGAVPIWESCAHADTVSCVAFSPDGTRVVSGSYDRIILVSDAHDGTVLLSPLIGHTNGIFSVAFSPDGKRVVSGSLDRAVRVWDVQSGRTVIGPLEGHTDVVTFVALPPNSARIISGSADRTIRIWDIAAILEAGTASLDGWSIDNDGWLADSRVLRLFWVPPELRRGFGFLTSSSPIAINASCTVRIDGTTLLGDRWGECYDVSI